MGFYDLPKAERAKSVEEIRESCANDLRRHVYRNILKYASDDDAYVRKNTYLVLGRLYRDHPDLRPSILDVLDRLLRDRDEKVGQTAVHALGEIGRVAPDRVMPALEVGLNDRRHRVRNAVVGALKRMGERKPEPTIRFAREFLRNSDPLIRRAVIHGIELRGRTHPEDILPILEELQGDGDRRVIEMVVHVLGQTSYKEGCLEEVIGALKGWENRELVRKALQEILDVHRRYEGFSAKTYDEAREYLEHEFGKI